MRTCCVRNIKIGEGKPKVCLPIVGIDDYEILSILASFQELEFDLIELRIDFYKEILNQSHVLALLKQVRLKTEKPILLTYRSQREGGQVQLTDEQYKDLVQYICQSQFIDLIDIELMSGPSLVYELVEIAHRYQVKVVISNHDFVQTPPISDMRDRLEKMEVFNADILKLAVMPVSHKDVMALLNLTLEMSTKLDKPVVTMSMGQLGVFSRISGELTGSAITFASAGKASAPGQIHVSDMQTILKVVHND